RDSALTAVEPELAVIVGGRGRIVGYTVGNDLSAWDIERANPLFLPQSKIFAGCFAMGPVLATPQEVGDPGSLALTCRILRDGRLRYEGRVNTKEMKRPCAELVEWLGRSNPVPAGPVLSTGPGILVPAEHALSGAERRPGAAPRHGRGAPPARGRAARTRGAERRQLRRAHPRRGEPPRRVRDSTRAAVRVRPSFRRRARLSHTLDARDAAARRPGRGVRRHPAHQ